MFDIGFLELLICGIIALLVLGPERLPGAARTAGRWVGQARRMVSQFSSELDSQLKADELREQLRQAGDVGLDDVKKTVTGALDEAKQFEHLLKSTALPSDKPSASAKTSTSNSGDDNSKPPAGDSSGPGSTPASTPDSSPDSRT